MTQPRPTKLRSWIDTIVALSAEVVGLLAQVLLIVLGVNYLVKEDTDELEFGRLVLWAIVATIYLATTVLWVNIDLRVRREDNTFVRRLTAIAPVRWFSVVVTFCSSIVGLAAAVTLILTRDTPDHLAHYELAAVWAMLASWAMFHWGYARIYYSIYHRNRHEPQLIFPRTENPRLVDFIYFAFTNGTSFAASDVAVATTRMRWTVVWHTTMSFFFNALIIVLTMNTISGGFAGL